MDEAFFPQPNLLICKIYMGRWKHDEDGSMAAFQPAIDEFNELRKDCFAFSFWSIADEGMSA